MDIRNIKKGSNEKIDWEAREKSDKVYQNMLLSPVPIAVLVLAGPAVLKMDVDELIQSMNLCSSVDSVEIKPYSINQANNHNVSHADYEEFVKKWIESPVKKNFEFINEYYIRDVISKDRNAFSDDHVYITPNGNFGVLEFDLNDNEFFLEYDSLEEYFKWCETEKVRVTKNKYCKNCEYYGNCLSEHLREVKSLEHSCNGFKNLIDWYARLEN
jgi:hypothetical protein